jgi:hypothetical protein
VGIVESENQNRTQNSLSLSLVRCLEDFI